MSKPVQFLVAVASIVVIAAGVWQAYSWYGKGNQTEILSQRVKEAERAERAERCKIIVASWDSGNKNPAEQKFGSQSENGIKFCRVLIEAD